MALTWRVHATLSRSAANGPGTRFVVWAQGCTLGCAGCFNPETHGAGGDVRTVADVAREALATSGIDGVTVSGGEPLEQPDALREFCALVRPSGLGIVVLTGFARAEIEANPGLSAAVEMADMVIAGRYNARLRLGTGLRGSSNKEYWAVTERYLPDDFAGIPESEVVISADGTIAVTGMHAWGDR
ncbi:4Fe-4S single cluster domain-containing protein [Actinomadura algeriensis]|uniref:Anaerobic ribonucleoside-triphosphate reductase-activating protein n=1 Tax=Actinomadura algeriensis TaxID=1679523 RepID=A0ABR9JJI9_9ACTN|nr:4Fe-4S single cluster domain-containing protein [Actinomadura algeriensis]MBE1530551.1 anaerobic ribonucleoside-triphosphate reductase activating protein [Actinomadura algeriensis]